MYFSSTQTASSDANRHRRRDQQSRFLLRITRIDDIDLRAAVAIPFWLHDAWPSIINISGVAATIPVEIKLVHQSDQSFFV